MSANAIKHITEVSERINLTQLATGNQAVNDSSSFGTSVTSGEEPVFASDGKTV